VKKLSAGKVLLGLLVIFTVWTCSTPDRLRYNTITSGVFKVDMRIKKKTRKPKQSEKKHIIRRWKLEIPRAYVDSWHGRDGIDYEPAFSITLHGKLNPDTMKIEPYPDRKARLEEVDNKIIIKLQEYGGTPRKGVRSCMTWDEYYELRQLKSRNPGCKDRSYFCDVRMHTDGWNTNLSMDRKLYNNPLPVCTAVKAFLDNMTIQRDSFIE